MASITEFLSAVICSFGLRVLVFVSNLQFVLLIQWLFVELLSCAFAWLAAQKLCSGESFYLGLEYVRESIPE